MDHCKVCSTETLPVLAKYKCPKCLIKYCSVTCWNTHTQSNCEKVEDQKSSVDVKQNILLFATEDTVRHSLLEQLKYSEELKALLRNPALREIIKEVDSAEKVRPVIERAMKEPIFNEFADVCLKIVEPPELENIYDL
ncbi:UNVERIFIED_CONTAM: hypothetical protein RMT77_001586 [Armadillidium vulgare]